MAEVRVPFDGLATSDLVVGAIYEGGPQPNIAADPIAPLLGVGNMGGFRVVGGPMPEGCLLVGLFATEAQDDWPDHYDTATGVFTYFGDNRTPGTDLHETKKGGNELLKYMFDCIHDSPPRRDQIPPVFIFRQVPDSGRDVRFLGLAAPGIESGTPEDDLEVVTRGEGVSRIANYRARFTVLDAPVVSRRWIRSLQEGETNNGLTPAAWVDWVRDGSYRTRWAGSRAVRFMIPSGGPEGWQSLLADPELHWKKGYSARTMAHATSNRSSVIPS